MNENNIILQAVREVFDERFEREMKALEGAKPHVFSKKHQKKMARLIKAQRKPYFKFISSAGRRAACIIAAIVILSVSALSVKAIRKAVFDFIMSIFSDHTIVAAKNGADGGYPETIMEEYYISQLPEGFEEVQHGLSDTALSVTYKNDSGNFILFKQQVKSEYETYYDNYTNNKKVTYNERDYTIIEYGSETIYVWDNGRYIFEISTDFNKELLLGLCESTKIKS